MNLKINSYISHVRLKLKTGRTLPLSLRGRGILQLGGPWWLLREKQWTSHRITFICLYMINLDTVCLTPLLHPLVTGDSWTLGALTPCPPVLGPTTASLHALSGGWGSVRTPAPLDWKLSGSGEMYFPCFPEHLLNHGELIAERPPDTKTAGILSFAH